MNQDKTPTLTVFRKFKEDGEIIAIFPEIPHDTLGRYCMSYMHTGQHGATCGVVDITHPARPEEYADLKAELESIGYKVEPRQKITQAMRTACVLNAKKETSTPN